jgi:class 3 adenylate cyclase/tetratricopeptide (TPR) repeat protein
VTCPACRQATPPGAAVCGVCGARLESLCPSCGLSNPWGSRFCNACGTALTAKSATDRFTSPRSYTPKHLAERILSSRAALQGERKQVTVLFADLQGFSELAERLDLEDLHLLMDEVFAVLLDAVHRYDGTINQFLGDGIMALFGAPVALEDHALRAVQAALEIQQTFAARAADFRTRFGAAPALRIGLNSGRVVVGKIGDDLRMDYTAQGDTVNLAARLQQLAEAGTVAASPATHWLVADSVECRSLGMHSVKGKAAPVEVFRPVRALEQDERSGASSRRGLSPFIGREEELGRLGELFADASLGHPQSAIVTGEAGAGKSRLLLELHRRIDRPGLRWFAGHCVPYGRSTPYRSILKSLRAACGLHDNDPPEEALRTLDELLAPLGEQRQRVGPLLRHLLGLQPPETELSLVLAPDRGAAITRALDAVIEVLAAGGPLVLVLEDCQWLDPVSAEYLTLISQRLASGRILFILTYRPGDWGQPLPRPPGEQILLCPLTAAESHALVTGIGGDRLAPDLVTLAVNRAGGNPLFLEEVTRTLVESGTESIPPTVEALLRARIDRLSPGLKVTVETASVIGQEFSRALLGQVLGEPVDVTAALRELVNQGLVAESDGTADLFRFRQPLLQEVAYEGWLLHRRRALHRRIGETIERLYSQRLFEHVEKLARHFTRAEEWERAAHYHRAAGRKAASLCANREAIQRFERALDLLGRLPGNVSRTKGEIDVRLDLCSPKLQLGRLDEVLRLCQDAESLAKEVGDQGRLAHAYSHLGNYHYMNGEPDTATEFARLCLTVSSGVEVAAMPHSPLQYLGTCYHVLGRYQEAVTILTQQIEAIEREDEFRRFGPTNLSYVSSCGWLAFTLADLGEFARAHSAAAKGTGAAAMAGHAYVQAIASTFAGLVWHTQGELDRALPVLRQSLDTCLEHQLVVWRPIAAALLGHTYVLQGQVSQGLDLLGEAATLRERLQVRAYSALWTARLAEALLVAGELPAAVETARRAVQLAVQYKEPGNHARALIVLGTALFRVGAATFTDARDSLQQGLLETQRLGMRPLLARCYDVLGRLASEQGDTAAAWQLRQTSASIERELNLKPWWEPLTNPSPSGAGKTGGSELRRHPRTAVSWPVTVDTPQRRLHLQTTNMSAVGAKVRPTQPLEIGTPAQLHFQRPDGRSLDVQARVSRADADGLVFAFISDLGDGVLLSAEPPPATVFE